MVVKEQIIVVVALCEGVVFLDLMTIALSSSSSSSSSWMNPILLMIPMVIYSVSNLTLSLLVFTSITGSVVVAVDSLTVE